MSLSHRIASFTTLGEQLLLQLREGQMDALLQQASAANPWFTPDSIRTALHSLAHDLLEGSVLQRWVARYPHLEQTPSRRIGVVMAGNIPLVGFSDLLCIGICGHQGWVKASSKDQLLCRHLLQLLHQIDPTLCFTPWDGSQLPDALIATGSDATRALFAARYPTLPTLLRGSRHSVAVLDGTETSAELEALAQDAFLYYGLGCRNISQIWVPRTYDLSALRVALAQHPIDHPGYRHNYLQTRAMHQLSAEPYLDGGFFLLHEAQEPSLRLSELIVSRYDSLVELSQHLRQTEESLQCVVSHCIAHPRRVDFGQAQHPAPWDYPDGNDVIEFLTATIFTSTHTPTVNS